MERVAEILKRLKPLTIFVKRPILDARQSSEYAFGLMDKCKKRRLGMPDRQPFCLVRQFVKVKSPKTFEGGTYFAQNL